VGFGGDLEVIRTTRAVWRHCEFARAVKMDAERSKWTLRDIRSNNKVKS
jgi:hypothetical protein